MFEVGPRSQEQMMLPTASGRSKREGRDAQAGFTLMELLVVLVIVGLLAAFVSMSVL